MANKLVKRLKTLVKSRSKYIVNEALDREIKETYFKIVLLRSIK